MTTRIRAAVARASGAEFTIEALDLEDPRDDEILVRVVAVGICHTDLAARDGAVPFALPAVFGHEGAGVVERVGREVTKVSSGDRVVMTFRSCGRCPRCAGGDPAYCASLFALNFAGSRPDGSATLRQGGSRLSSSFFAQSSFATHALAYERNQVKLPDDVPFEVAAPLGCGVQTGAGAAMTSLACEPGSSLLVTGAGAVGLSAVMGAALRGCGRIVVVEPHRARRELAVDLGATDALEPGPDEGLAAAVCALLPQGADYCIDTTGRPATLAACMGALGSKGVLGVVGIPPPGAAMPGDLGTLLAMGQSLRGIIEGDSNPDVFIPQLLGHWREGRLPIEKLVRAYPLDRINEAVSAQLRGDCVKAVLTMEG